MKKVALVLRGGISRVSGRLLIPNQVSSPSSNYVNFDACAKSLKYNLIDRNLDCKFDLFIQSWNPDLQVELSSIYKPVAANYELNQSYAPLLNTLTKKVLVINLDNTRI